jgi:hypothetical protein
LVTALKHNLNSYKLKDVRQVETVVTWWLKIEGTHLHQQGMQNKVSG